MSCDRLTKELNPPANKLYRFLQRWGNFSLMEDFTRRRQDFPTLINLRIKLKGKYNFRWYNAHSRPVGGTTLLPPIVSWNWLQCSAVTLNWWFKWYRGWMDGWMILLFYLLSIIHLIAKNNNSIPGRVKSKQSNRKKW